MLISCVILVLVAGGYALWPLFVKTAYGIAVTTAETDTDYLVARKSALYRNIKELQFEYKIGRLTESDFMLLENEYKSEAVEILQKLDILKDSTTIHDPQSAIQNQICPSCGSNAIPGKKFCADCGTRL